MAAKKIRIGIAGAQWVGNRHAEAFRTIPGVELAAVADVDDQARMETQKAHGIAQGYADYVDMIKQGGLDAVVIALPTWMHAQASSRALRAGLHVLCEKPPTSNVAEMKRVARVAEATGMTYMFARQSRFNPGVLASRAAVRAGKLGTIYHGEAVWARSRWNALADPGWRMDSARGGGVLLDLGVHVIDEVWFCMGCPRPVEVSAGLHAGFRHFSKDPGRYTADDCATGLIRFENHATLAFLVTFALNGLPPGDRQPDGDPVTPQDWRAKVIYGSKGGLRTDSGTLIKGGCNDISAEMLPRTSTYSEFQGQARAFVRSIRSGSTPVSSAGQAVMIMQMLEAAQRSADKGKAIRIRH